VAIEKQSLNINFAKGLDQKTDPLQVQPGRFLGLTNRVFNKMGRLEKRNGNAAKGQSVATPVGSYTFSQIPGTVAAGRNTTTYSNELVLNDGLNMYSYAPSSDNWVYKGRVELCQTSQQSIYKNKFENIVPDSALNSTLGINVFAWESWTASPYQISNAGSATLNGVQISSIDSTSGQTIFNSYLASNTSRPKCVSISNKLYVLYFNSGDSKLYAQPVTQAGLGATVAIITDINATTPNYDVIVNNSLIYIAYNGTGTSVKVASFNSSLVSQATVSKAESGSNGVGLFPDTSNNIWVAYNNGSATKAFIMNSALAVTVLAPTVVDNAAAATSVLNVTGVYDGTRGIIYYDKPGGPIAGQATGDGTTNYVVSANFTQPAVGATVTPTISGPSSNFQDFFSNNSIVYIPTGGYYFITGAIVGSNATLANLGLTGNAAPGATVASTRQIIYPTAGFQNSIVTYNTLTALGVAGTPSTLCRSMYLAGKAYLVNSVPHVITGFDSSLQSTYFSVALYNINATVALPSGVCVAKIAESAGGGPPYRSLLPAVNVVSTGIVQFAFPERTLDILRTSNNSSNSTYILGVSSARIDFTTNDVQNVDLGRNLQIGSGITQMYDGASAVEQGFTVYPETVTAVFSGSGGDLNQGTLGYKIVYEWIDNLGQVHRSAPSPNLSMVVAAAPAAFTADTTNGSSVLNNVSTITGLQVGQGLSGTGIAANTYVASINSATQVTMSANATATNAGVTITVARASAVTLTIPTLRITEKQNVTIAIYRTLVNGTVYFRVDTQYFTYPIANSIATDTVSFTDVSSDDNISGNEQLYTDQEVENIAPPATLALAEYKNRVILIPSDNPYVWQYSKQVINGSPVEFSDLFSQNMGTTGGPLVGAAKLDDKLILFKGQSIYYVTGTGPSPSGTGNDFSDPQFITADAGLLSPRSIVTTPVGLMFKSSKGIYLLDRSLQTRYIGKAVEDYNVYTVRGAQLIPKSNQIRFILSNGTALMYDYFWTDEEGIGQWAVFDNISAVSDCIFQNLHTFVTSAGLVYQENPGSYLDGATAVNTYFKTGWFNLAGLQGFERAYFFYFLAQYISAHTLTINLYYDYDATTVAQTIVITPNATDLEQWRVFLSKQKCEAFQIEMQESGSSGAGFTMSGLDLLVGIKGNSPRLKAAASAS
jgi:hypothetical protein